MSGRGVLGYAIKWQLLRLQQTLFNGNDMYYTVAKIGINRQLRTKNVRARQLTFSDDTCEERQSALPSRQALTAP